MFKKSFCAVVVSSLIVFPLSTPSLAEVSVAEDGKAKINLSGRQRMLSQRMAKAACFAAIDVDKAGHMEMLSAAHGLFDTTLSGLRNGSADQGMNPEKAPDIIQGLDTVEGLWGQYGTAVADALAAGDVTDDKLSIISELNVPTLQEMNRTVGLFEKKYGASGEIPPALAVAINVSGRQRMLTQKASKEFCLIVAGYNVEANRASLAKTVDLFETSLNALINGDASQNLPPAPTPPLAAQLETVQGIWTPLSTIFKAVAGGATPSADDIALVAKDNNPALVEMNKAVQMYASF